MLILAATPGLGTAATFTVSILDLNRDFLAVSQLPGIARDQVTLQVFQVTGGVDQSIFGPAPVSTGAAVRIIVSDTPIAVPPPGAIVIVQPNVDAVRLQFSSNDLRTATVDLINSDQTIQVPMPLDMLAYP